MLNNLNDDLNNFNLPPTFFVGREGQEHITEDGKIIYLNIPKHYSLKNNWEQTILDNFKYYHELILNKNKIIQKYKLNFDQITNTLFDTYISWSSPVRNFSKNTAYKYNYTMMTISIRYMFKLYCNLH